MLVKIAGPDQVAEVGGDRDILRDVEVETDADFAHELLTRLSVAGFEAVERQYANTYQNERRESVRRRVVLRVEV